MIAPSPTLERVAAPDNLLAAYRRARRGKRDRPEVASFEIDLEYEIADLREHLLSETYRPGSYRVFWVRDPVLRRISAAPFRDRVVHQALCHVLEPTFEAEFLSCSFACRRGKGTHRALRAASYWARRRRFVLHADVRKFFPSIDHRILDSLLRTRIVDSRLADLCSRIIAASNPQDEIVAYFPGDDLFTPFERRRGLPIGNLTSQWFANLTLHPVDRFVTCDAGEDAYIRYMDDILLFGDDPGRLRAMAGRIDERMALLRLRLHRGKTEVHRTSAGFGFLGFEIFPTHRLLLRRSANRARRRLRRLAARYRRGEIDLSDVSRSVQAWVAHTRHGDTYRLRSRIFRDIVFSREAAPGP